MSENNSIKKEKKEKKPKERSIEKNKWKTLSLFSVGGVFAFIGFLLMALSYALPYLLKNSDLGISNDVLSLIAFIFGAGLLLGGLFVCAKMSILSIPKDRAISDYLNAYFENREKPDKTAKFYSLQFSRIIAAACLLVLGFLDLFILTGAISHHQSPFGQAIVLGGPSYYYTIALFPNLFGIALVIFVFGSTCRMAFSASKNDLTIHEFRPYAPWITEIRKDEIEALRYQNTQLGPKFLWLLILIPVIILSFLEGLYLIQAPGLDNPIQPILMMVSAGLEVVALFFLLYRPQKYFEIATKDDLYEVFFDPYDKDQENLKTINNDIESVFECSNVEMKATDFMKANGISTTHRDYTKLIIGVILVIASIPMWLFFLLFGNFYYFTATIWGSILIVRFISHDYSDVGGVTIENNESDKTFKYRQRFRDKFYNVCAFKPKEVKLTRQFRKLNAFDVLAIPAMLAFLTIQLVQGWLFADEMFILILMAYSTAFMVLVCVMVFIFLCVPIDQVAFKTDTIEYYIPVSVEMTKHLHLKAAFSEPLKKTFIIRCSAIALIIILSIIGILLSLSSNFA